MTKANELVQVLRAELLRPVRVHLRSSRIFIVRATDHVLGDLDGFIVSRPTRTKGNVYVEEIRSKDVAALDLKLKWRLPVTREKPLAGKATATGIRETLGISKKSERNVARALEAAGVDLNDLAKVFKEVPAEVKRPKAKPAEGGLKKRGT